MNKKGQAIIVFIMLGIMAFIFAVVTAPVIKDEITITMNSSSLNCTNPSISTYKKATCTILDFGFFYFISILIAISIAFVAGKKNVTGIMTSIFVFVVVVSLITPLKDLIITFRDATHLDCASASVAVGVKLTCIFVDLWLFYFIATAIASAVTFIFIKKVLK